MDPATTAAAGTADSGAGGAAPERLLATAQQLAAQHGASGPRRPGRPIIHGAYSQAAGSSGKKPAFPVPGRAVVATPAGAVAPLDPAAAGPVLDPALLRSCLEAGFTAVNEIVTGHCYRRTLRLSEDKQLAAEIGAAVDVTKPRLTLLCGTGTAILQKYELVGQYFPEIAFGLGLASWGLQVGRVLKRLDQLEAQRLKEQSGEKPRAAQGEGG